MEEKNYLIKYESFSGPVNLLLELVRKRKIDIYEINLNSIILDFLDYIRKYKDVILETLSGFLYIASILLEIKSNSIIPSKSALIHGDEDTGMDVLKIREDEYKVFKKISNYLEKLEEVENLYFLREAPIEKEFNDIMPDFLEKLSIDEINYLASKLLKNIEIKMNFENIYLDNASITVYQEMERVSRILGTKNEITFEELSGTYKELIDKIICFLSILELYKNEIIDILQIESFGSIIIKRIIQI
ncbi:MAG: segregation/condensation protein A [Actinobacteria bacterium]|nr:segregation/condensation protein A [Actinomycetota bacterium]